MRTQVIILLSISILLISGLILREHIPNFAYMEPRQGNVFTAVICYPFIHISWDHLFNNLVFLIPSTIIVYLIEKRNSILIVSMIYIGHGVLVWLLGRPGVHVGCSGVALGIGFYAVFACLFNHNKIHLIYLAILFAIYYSVFSSFMEVRPGVSDDAHVIGSITGFLVSLYRYLGKSQIFTAHF